ncbi:MAG: pyridoxal-dependent decarboxylase, partial [Proteobacteria bacterium]|nr:pyridoxal-dependent decarboxylase [Pseudomonadota bacterium]
MRKLETQIELNNLYESLKYEQDFYLGYPNNYAISYENLGCFLNLTLNNIGDPFVGNLGLNTCEIESEVVRTFAGWVSNNDPWGYVTNGSSESNLKALAMARQRYPDAVVLCSQDTHYSIPKASQLLGLKCLQVDSQANGEISYSHFHQIVKSLRRYPLIICANIGTTMKGAIDQIPRIEMILRELKIERYHLHCDAAHFGGYLAFIGEGKIFDFRNRIHSMSVS